MSCITTYGCPTLKDTCVLFDETVVPSVDIMFSGAIVPQAARPGAIKSWDITGGVTLADGTILDLMVDLIASTDSGPVDLLAGGLGGSNYIQVPNSTAIGVADHIFKFSYIEPSEPQLSRWKIEFSDIDGEVAGGTGVESVCFRSDEAGATGCGSDYSITVGDLITITPTTTVLDGNAYTCFEGPGNTTNDNDTEDHSIRVVSNKRSAELTILFRIRTTTVAAANNRQFYPRVPQFDTVTVCPGVPTIITKSTDCSTGVATYFDGTEVVNPQDFIIRPSSECV